MVGASVLGATVAPQDDGWEFRWMERIKYLGTGIAANTKEQTSIVYIPTTEALFTVIAPII